MCDASPEVTEKQKSKIMANVRTLQSSKTSFPIDLFHDNLDFIIVVLVKKSSPHTIEHGSTKVQTVRSDHDGQKSNKKKENVTANAKY